MNLQKSGPGPLLTRQNLSALGASSAEWVDVLLDADGRHVLFVLAIP